MAAISPSLVPCLVFARISGIAVAALVLSWALLFNSSFLPHSPVSSQEDPIFAILHPLLMVIGFILISGEAMVPLSLDYAFYIDTQMVAWFKEFEEIRAFVASRGGSRPGAGSPRWHCHIDGSFA
ncbi:hypothetical protein V6N11_011396 [Hibiscus sabdariffa]|uniref:Cytochrome b561 domain-containing protein n=1 Tax=Hibiscus sabdariffa TaxID=183260 RepID=A0ABR2S8E8_9ROSI